MDEPFGAVDAKNRVSLQDLLLKLWTGNGNQKTIFLVTHDIDEAIYLADRIAVFTPGPGRVLKTINFPFLRPRRRFFLVQDPRVVAGIIVIGVVVLTLMTLYHRFTGYLLRWRK